MKIICTLPNAPSLVNGVKFISHARGMISEDIADDAVAARLLRVTGYESADKPAAGPATDPAALAILDAAKRSEAQAKTALTRTGPLEPDNDMVICPTCTSQFRAVPVNVQTQLQALQSAPKGRKVTTPATGTSTPPPASDPDSKPSTDEKPAATASDPQF